MSCENGKLNRHSNTVGGGGGVGGISEWPILQSEDRTVSGCSRINIVWGSASSLLVLRLIYAVHETHIFYLN